MRCGEVRPTRIQVCQCLRLVVTRGGADRCAKRGIAIPPMLSVAPFHCPGGVTMLPGAYGTPVVDGAPGGMAIGADTPRITTVATAKVNAFIAMLQSVGATSARSRALACASVRELHESCTRLYLHCSDGAPGRNRTCDLGIRSASDSLRPGLLPFWAVLGY
jgi:hypothetical protein